MTAGTAAAGDSLVLRARDGDAMALEQLLELWYPRLLRQAACRFDREDATDVVQETLIKVAQNIGSLTNPAAFSKWVMEILRRRGIDYVRSERRHREGHAPFDEALCAAPNDDESRARSLDVGALLERAQRYLGRDSLEILRLRFVIGLSLVEISGVSRLPLGTVKSRLHAARGRLKQCLAYNA